MATETLRTERVATDALTTHPSNARRGDVGAISESLRVHGQFRPIVAQRATGHVLAGNHTLLAARALDWTEIDVVYLDVDDETAVRVMLADNRTAELASNDDAALAALLTDLVQSTSDGLTGTGFDSDSLDRLLADVAAPPDFSPAASGNGGGFRGPCPSCGFDGDN